MKLVIELAIQAVKHTIDTVRQRCKTTLMVVGLALAYVCGFSVRFGPYGTECPHCHGQIPFDTESIQRNE